MDEPDLDIEGLHQLLGPPDAVLQQHSGPEVDSSHAAQMGPEATEASPTSPGRPSESYEPDLPNWAVEGANAQTMPGSGLACVNCPRAVWMAGGPDLQAFCLVLRAITWSTREPVPLKIEICNAKELAILEMEDSEVHEQLREEVRASR